MHLTLLTIKHILIQENIFGPNQMFRRQTVRQRFNRHLKVSQFTAKRITFTRILEMLRRQVGRIAYIRTKLIDLVRVGKRII